MREKVRRWRKGRPGVDCVHASSFISRFQMLLSIKLALCDSQFSAVWKLLKSFFMRQKSENPFPVEIIIKTNQNMEILRYWIWNEFDSTL